MTQTQIVKELAETTGVGNKVAKQFLEKFTEIAVRETKKKGVFVMPGIGRLVRVERKARTGRNPATGESIKIPAKKVVKFRIAKAVKDAIVPPKAKKGSFTDRGRPSQTPPFSFLTKQKPRDIAAGPLLLLWKSCRSEPLETRPKCGQFGSLMHASFVGSSHRPSRRILKFRIPSPKPFATSGIFRPPNSRTAIPRMMRSSGKPSDLMRPPSYVTLTIVAK